MKIARIYILALISSISGTLFSQHITGLDHNPVIKAGQEHGVGFKSIPEDVYTPPFPANNLFFDDFSYYKGYFYPNDELWTDKYAYVNNTFADSLISMGVISLDAVNEKGEMYATSNSHVPSDTLTSIQINIPDDNLNYFLSFFVEPGGKVDAPEEKDTLILEFYYSDSSQWYKVWHQTGEEAHSFSQVILPVADSFKAEDFRFRFRNYTSSDVRDAPGGTESALSNGDFWHLDYIQLVQTENASDLENVNDVAFVKQIKPSFKNYFSMPYEHFQYSNSDRILMHESVFRTNFPEISDIDIERVYESFNVYKGKSEILNQASAENQVASVSYESWEDDFNPNYSYLSSQKYGHFLKKCYLVVKDTSQYRWNDTIEIQEEFFDYYASDDGSAEYAFGLPGNGGNYMQFANYFNFFNLRNGTPDTLTAIDLKFIKARNNSHGDAEFSPCIWAFDNGNPGEIIYPSGKVESWPRYYPDTNLGINDFMRIELEEDVLVPDTVFVGFVQFGTDFISLGYDINTNNLKKIRYNDGNGWMTPDSTIPPGTVMIRPVFDHKIFNSIKSASVDNYGDLLIAPNPSSDVIYVYLSENQGFQTDYRLEIINLLGKTVLVSENLSDEISVSQLQSGMYIVRIRNVETGKIFIQKFLKN